MSDKSIERQMRELASEYIGEKNTPENRLALTRHITDYLTKLSNNGDFELHSELKDAKVVVEISTSDPNVVRILRQIDGGSTT